MEIRAPGEPDLDRFFHKFAGQNQFKHYVGVTHVAVEDTRILGFATISPAHVEIEGLSATARKKLPRYLLPVLRLAHLAVRCPAAAYSHVPLPSIDQENTPGPLIARSLR